MSRRSVTTVVVTVAAVAALAATAPAATPADAAEASGGLASVRALVSEISAEHGVDPRLVHAVIKVESGYNAHAVSRRGALGLMQLMPGTARRLSVDDPFDPADNVRGGVRELARLLAVYHGDLPLALAAYNAGEGAVARYGGVPPFAETTEYVDRIMQLYLGRHYRGRGRSRSAPVRLVRGSGDVAVLITNQVTGARAPTDLPRLGGGIAISVPAGGGGRGLSGGFGAASR